MKHPLTCARLSVFVLFLLFFGAFEVSHAEQQPRYATEGLAALEETRSILLKRLSLMPGVARYKWENGLPVEDIEREALILKRTVGTATQKGLSSDYAEKAVLAQMTAAKMIQSGLFKTWGKDAELVEATPRRDLVTEIRPEISTLTDQLVRQLNKLETIDLECDTATTILVPPEDKSVAVDVWQIAAKGIIPPRLNCR